ncbi:MAG: hypothetical protein HOP17_07735 [Acidobacteria bacterium]|nr:hypothetical protein [Acidobacteriota bacterium]
MDYLATIDGDLDLKATERVCEDEQRGGFKLDSVKFGTVFDEGKVKLINNAAFDMANSTAILTNLEFRELGADNVDSVKTQMKAQGWTFICDSQVYDANQLKRVLVFGKN